MLNTKINKLIGLSSMRIENLLFLVFDYKKFLDYKINTNSNKKQDFIYLSATELKGKACFLLVPDFINYLVINKGITDNDVEFILDILDKEEFLKPKS